MVSNPLAVFLPSRNHISTVRAFKIENLEMCFSPNEIYTVYKMLYYNFLIPKRQINAFKKMPPI